MVNSRPGNVSMISIAVIWLGSLAIFMVMLARAPLLDEF
jgi:hypothetical protein